MRVFRKVVATNPLNVTKDEIIHIKSDGASTTLCSCGGIFDPNTQLQYVLSGEVTCAFCATEFMRIQYEQTAQ